MKKILPLCLMFVLGFALAKSVLAMTPPIPLPDSKLLAPRELPAIKDLKDKAKEAKENFKAGMENVRDQSKQEREDINNEAKDKLETLRQEHASSTASTTERRIAFQQDIAKRRAENTARVLTATVERLTDILNRVNSRIEKVKAAGGKTTDAEAAVALVAKDLEDAKVAISAMSSLDLTGLKARDNFDKVKAAADVVQAKIKDAHKNLSNAVSSLKMSEGKATSTPIEQ